MTTTAELLDPVDLSVDPEDQSDIVFSADDSTIASNSDDDDDETPPASGLVCSVRRTSPSTGGQCRPWLALECSPGGFRAESKTILGKAQYPRVKASQGFCCPGFIQPNKQTNKLSPDGFRAESRAVLETNKQSLG